MYCGLKSEILHIADYDPLGYDLLCCSRPCHEFHNFLISCSQHTVCTLCSKLAMKEIETCRYDTLVPELCNVE